jgi:signal transduction histidine kinase
MFTSRRIRFFFILIAGIAFGFLIQKVELRSLDNFFLDWRQILANGDAPEVPVKIVDISALKPTVDSGNTSKLDVPKLVALIQKIAAKNPNAIVLEFSWQEIDMVIGSPDWNALIAIPNLYVQVNDDTGTSNNLLIRHPAFIKFPRQAKFILTWDSRQDQVARRNILYFDTDKKILSDNFRYVEEFTGKKVSAEIFDKNFVHMETLQAYLKIWPNEKFGNIAATANGLDEASLSKLSNQLVIISTSDIFAMLQVPSIMSRVSFFYGVKLNETHWPEARVLATFVANIYSGEYIKQPTFLQDALWISFWTIILLFSVFLLEPKIALLAGFLWPLVFILISLVVFRITSLNFDMSRILIANFLLQYTVAPIRLMQGLRKKDRQELERIAELKAEREKSKFLVKVASSDMQMRVVAQVSHDIRSPLMALQIAHKVIKGSISDEAGELIQGSIERLKYIAEDTLSQYRNEESRDVQVNLKDSLDDLARTFKILYPDVVLKINIPLDLNILWPPHSLARAFTNLFNNSIEAFGKTTGLVIEVTAEIFEERNVIRVQDNGPGIPENVLPKLFQAGGTFGKSSGTGLGLYQVRKDLADFGGRVQVLASATGALFEIVLPRYLDKLEVKVTRKLLVVANGDLPLSYDGEFEVIRYRSLQEAKKFILLEPDISTITLIMDLVFPNEEETGFDLIESMGAFRPYKIFVCTSLGENDEIRRLSDRYDVLLVTRAMMSRFYLKA